MGADIELHIFLEGPDAREPKDVLKVTAAAIDQRKENLPDGEKWLRAKIVRAQMEKKGEHYVWRRWF